MVVRGLAFLLLVVVCVAAIRLISGDSQSRPRQLKSALPDTGPSLSALAGPRMGKVTARNRRVVYPYSVVPGGVSSVEELRQVAAHDPTVARHYAEFNYSRSRVIEAKQSRLVYLSYRRDNKIYWTHKQASLHPGEKLISDGQITARTRCGNQVSVLPRAETSPEEPPIAELDRPDALASGIEAFPSNLSSNLLNVDPGMPVGPSSGSGGGMLPGGAPGAFVPIPIGGPIGAPGGGGGPVGTPGGGGCITNCNPGPPPPPPATVPEPGTIVLVLSGAAAVVAKYRKAEH